MALEAEETVDIAIVGAGPCGLAAAVTMLRAGMSCLVLDGGAVTSTITAYPTYVNFFSTAEKLSLGGLPFVVPPYVADARVADGKITLYKTTTK